MSFTIGKFFGLTLRGFRGQIGYGNQTSLLNIDLVQDVVAGDAPIPVPHGTPAYFQYYNYNFGGLLQKFEKVDSIGGFLYQAILIDPREILEGTQVIIGNFIGQVGGVKNLINAYGYLENISYGRSGSTNAGMPWVSILEALNSICNVPAYGNFGGPLTYRGVAYSIDLSEIPVPPPFYRIGGNCVGLLEMIAQVCEDCGCDFFVELVGLTIKVRICSRYAESPLNTINAMVAANSGLVVNSGVGVECRNEITSAFLVGGEKTTLHLSDGIESFWGYDILGNPILGTLDVHPDIDGLHEYMYLNAQGVADIVADTSYFCNTVEMRMAMAAGTSSLWALYIERYKPKIYEKLQTVVEINRDLPQAKVDTLGDNLERLQAMIDNTKQINTERLWQFVRGYATEFYGKQFLVKIPFVLHKTDPETLVVTHSQEPTNAAFVAEGAESLGLSILNEDVFKEQDDRFLPFAIFPTINGADTTRVNWADTVVESNLSMYTRCNMEQAIIPVTIDGVEIPTVLVRLSSVLYDVPLDPFGSAPILNPLLNAGNDGIQNVDKNALMGTIGFYAKINPAARKPTIVAVPLKSNIENYGPWLIAGAPGKVRFEYDSSLTPWEYGGYGPMNAAGNARVQNAITNMQLSESGYIELAAVPAYGLGDILQTGGPNMTGVDVTVGTQGVTTAYRFNTFTPRFGMFSKANAERMKRIALGQAQLRRDVRKALNRAVASLQTVEIAYASLLAHAPKYVKKDSPHDVFMAKVILDNEDSESMRVGATLGLYEEGLAFVRPDDDSHKNNVVMSVTGLFRPFTTRPSSQGVVNNDDGVTLLPMFKQVHYSTYTEPNNAINKDTLNPFADGHDIEVVTNKDTYDGMHAYRRGSDPYSTRAIALRGPLVVAGWGYGIDGYRYPSVNDEVLTEFHSNTLRKSQKWKAGPVDLLWDDKRGVWTSHDLITAKTPDGSGLPAGSSIPVNVGGNQDWQLEVSNKFSSDIPENTWIIAGYCLNENKWYAIAADCGV